MAIFINILAIVATGLLCTEKKAWHQEDTSRIAPIIVSYALEKGETDTILIVTNYIQNRLQISGLANSHTIWISMMAWYLTRHP